jgi:hypothetical protein
MSDPLLQFLTYVGGFGCLILLGGIVAERIARSL